MAAAALVAAGLAGWKWRAQAANDRLGRWAAVDAGQVVPFWNCLFAKEVEVSQLNNGQQARRLVEAAYAGQKRGFAGHLTADCLPRLVAARRSLDGLAAPGLAGYAISLARLETAVRLYSERLAGRASSKEVDENIVAEARAWYAASEPAARTAAYERFLGCAVPELPGLADDQALYRLLADRCFKNDPAPFMWRVRTECAPLLGAQAAPASSYAASRKKFRGPDAAQVQSWESCSDIARAQQRMADAAELVAAADAYLAARPARPAPSP